MIRDKNAQALAVDYASVIKNLERFRFAVGTNLPERIKAIRENVMVAIDFCYAVIPKESMALRFPEIHQTLELALSEVNLPKYFTKSV